MNNLRLYIDGLLLFFLLLGVAPLFLFFGFVYALRTPGYWELLVGGFVFELLYGVGGWQFPFPFPVFFGAALLLFLASVLRRILRS
jgi:hypothetical protein